MRQIKDSSTSYEANQDRGRRQIPYQWPWIAFGILLIGYGLLAFNAGSKISPLTNKAANNLSLSKHIMLEAEKGIDVRGSEEVLQTMPGWMNFMAHLSSSKYVYGQDSLMETEIYYHAMPESRRAVLSSHMMLGVVLMTTGFFQFWPAFRRRYRKVHRITGVIYVVAAFTSMTLSCIHLMNTGIANTYDTYAFHMGLWMMLVGVVFSISMASIAIFRKKIASHMGWQAIGFGFLLTAPVQRVDWIIMAPFSGDLSFNEMNTAVNTLLFVQVTLLAYLLFLLNRGSSVLRSKEIALTSFTSRFYSAGIVVLIIICLFGLMPLFMVTSLNDISILQRMIPEQALALLGSEVNSVSKILYASATAVLMISSWIQLKSLRDVKIKKAWSNYAVCISALLAGGICLFWGHRLGMPSHEHGVAGTGFFVLGSLLVLFLGLFAWSQQNEEWGKAVEWLQFLLLISMAPALFAMNIWALDRFNLVPEPYLSQAAGLELATIIAVFIPVLIGFILSIYSDETKRYRVS